MKKYICIETSQVLSKEECKNIYKNDINKREYQDFETWCHDMIKNSILIEVDLIKEIQLDNEKCYIFQNNEKDFEIFFDNSDYTVYGTLEDIKEEFFYHTNKVLNL